jgi:hypothetical protein
MFSLNAADTVAKLELQKIRRLLIISGNGKLQLTIYEAYLINAKSSHIYMGLF